MTTAERDEIFIGEAGEIAVGKFRIIRQGALNIGVTRLADGSLRAVRNTCPHKGAPICRGTIGGTWPPSAPGELDYGREGEILVCPWHGFEYDLKTGEELYRKVPTRLRFYEVVERDGRIYVVVNKRALEASGAEATAA
jgi:nitrite reductase/ring-hydroxylating ferredoxin subunit